jgi:DNA-binding NtrC family response regulator
MMTGYSARPRVQAARDTGVTEFLVKPFSADSMAKRIAHVINRPRDFVAVEKGYFGPDRRRKKTTNYNGPKRREED